MAIIVSDFEFSIALAGAVPIEKLRKTANLLKSDVPLAKSQLVQWGKHSFSSESVIQWQRAVVPLSVSLIDEASVGARVFTVPRRSSAAFARPGKSALRLLDGECRLRIVDIDSAELCSEKQPLLDGYIQNAEDDCVCRGGICPRRFGCPFWVEKQQRDAASGLIFVAPVGTDLQLCTTLNQNVDTVLGTSSAPTVINTSETSHASFLEVWLRPTQQSADDITYYDVKSAEAATLSDVSARLQLRVGSRPVGMMNMVYSNPT